MTIPTSPLSDKEQVLGLIEGITGLPPYGPVPDTLEGPRRSLAGWLGRLPGTLQHPRIAQFAGAHPGADAASRNQAEAYMEQLLGASAPLCKITEAMDADLRVYELDLKAPRPVTEASLVRAAAYGMMAVEPGVDIMGAGGFGGGLDEAALALIERLPGLDDPFGALDNETVAALAGTIIAARLAEIPLILDGACAVAALLALCRLNPTIADHCATSWQPPKAARQWFREQTELQFMPASGKDEAGLEGAALLEMAMSL